MALRERVAGAGSPSPSSRFASSARSLAASLSRCSYSPTPALDRAHPTWTPQHRTPPSTCVLASPLSPPRAAPAHSHVQRSPSLKRPQQATQSNYKDIYSTHLDLEWTVDWSQRIIRGSVKHHLQVANDGTVRRAGSPFVSVPPDVQAKLILGPLLAGQGRVRLVLPRHQARLPLVLALAPPRLLAPAQASPEPRLGPHHRARQGAQQRRQARARHRVLDDRRVHGARLARCGPDRLGQVPLCLRPVPGASPLSLCVRLQRRRGLAAPSSYRPSQADRPPLHLSLSLAARRPFTPARSSPASTRPPSRPPTPPPSTRRSRSSSRPCASRPRSTRPRRPSTAPSTRPPGPRTTPSRAT